MTFSWSIDSHKTLSSTQDHLKNLLRKQANLPEGFVVQSLSQTQGHGRHGRVWQAGEGNLYLSFLLRPMCDPALFGQVALMCGCAVAVAIEGFISSSRPVLKWPNDVLIEGRKCCGILIEAVEGGDHRGLIVGLGVNVDCAPSLDFTCINDYADDFVDLDALRDHFFAVFQDYYMHWQADGFDVVRRDWLERSFAKGRSVQVKVGNTLVSGVFEGIDKHGHLLLICDKTGVERVIVSGDVFVI